MSDSESDVPDLVNSSSEDEESEPCKCTLTIGDTVRQFSGRSDSDKHLHLMKVYTVAPLLLGKGHQPELWLKYAHDSKLLPTTAPEEIFVKITIDDPYLHVTEVLQESITLVQNQLIERKVTIEDLHTLFESIDRTVFPILKCLDHQPRPLEDVLHKAKDFTFLHEWKNIISGKQNIMKPDPEYLLDDRQLVVCLLFATRQYLAYALSMEHSDFDVYRKFEEQCGKTDKEVAHKKEQGNMCFKAKNYKGAIDAYTEAIHCSRYSAILYGNRAQSFSQSKMYREALCDSLRSIALDPRWHKGYYRCAQALFDLKRIEMALKITELGIRRCPYDKNLKDQMLKFTKYINENPLPPHKRLKKLRNMFHDEDEQEDDEPPDLVTSSDNDSDSDSSDSDTASSKQTDPVYERFLESQNKKAQEKKEKEKLSEKPNKKAQEEKERKEKEKKEREEEIKRLEENRRKEEERRNKKFEEERRERERKEREEREKREVQARKKKEKEAEAQKEKEKKQKIMREKEEKDNRHTELLTFLSDGSKALLEERVNNALLYYGKAMDYIDKYGLPYFSERFKDVDYVVVKYSLGDACVKMGTNKEIQQSMSWFNEILEKHKNVKFPLAFLGLGRAYHRQNRFSEALEPLRKGVQVVKKLSSYGVHTWPGSNYVIEETRSGKLIRALEELIMMCRHPPIPEAMCRYHHCSPQYRIRIYINDPDLKGFVRVRCFAKCKIEYHIDCWRKLKKERISSSDKDYLNIACFTPNCKDRISEIHIFDQNGAQAKELKAPEREKPLKNNNAVKLKTKPSNELKIAKKAERKAKRKEYKENKARQKAESEAKSASTDVLDMLETLEENTDRQNSSQHRDERAIPGPQHSPVMVLKKEAEDIVEPRGKTKKSKKRDKTTKVTMSLDEFVGREGEVYEDEDGVLHRTPAAAGLESYSSKASYPAVNSSSPFAPPSSILNDVKSFESSFKKSLTSCLPGEKHNEMTNSLMQFFSGILREHGPLLQDDVVIRRELEEFPKEARDMIQNAGGLGKFLIQSLEFAMIDDVVCLMKDAVKARELAQAYKTPFKDRYVNSKAAQQRPPPSITSQILDPSVGGFPNKMNVQVIKNPETSNPVIPEQENLFADLNFDTKTTSRLDQLDFIEDTNPQETNPTTPSSVVNSVPHSFSAPTFTPSSAPNENKSVSKSESAKVLDDIDDEISDIASAENRSQASLTGSGTYNVNDLFKKQGSQLTGKNSQDSGSDKLEQTDDKKSRFPNVSHPSVSDIARLDDLDTFSRGSSDALDDIPLHDFTNVTRNQNHIQELKQFTDSLANGTANDFSMNNALPEIDSTSLSFRSSPTSSVYSLPKSKTDERSNSLYDRSPVVDQEPLKALNIDPEPLKTSRLKDWLPKSADKSSDEKQNEDDSLDHENLTGGILSNPAAWRHKKVDLECLESMGGLGASDEEDIDATKPDLSVDGRAGDQDPSPARTDHNSSPFGAGSRSVTPDSRSIHSASPSVGLPSGLPRPSVGTEDSTIYPRSTSNVYGAIGSRTESPLHGSVSSRGSSKTGTPLHTPKPNPEPLPLFPSAHDGDDFPAVIASDLTSISKQPNFSLTIPKMDKTDNTLFSNSSSTLFPTNGFENGNVNPTSHLFPIKPSLWDNHNDLDESQPEPLDGVDIDDEVKKHHQRIDDEFVREMSLDAYNKLKNDIAFKDNPNLLKQIEQSVRRDVEGDQTTSRGTRKLRNAAVQYDPRLNSISTACNTDPYEPNKEKLTQAEALLDQTNLRYIELMDKHTMLKNSSGVEIKELRSRLDATEQECKGLRSEASKAVDERDSEMRKWSQEKRHLSEEIKSLRQKYSAAKSVESNANAQLREHKTQFDRVNQELTTERETIIQEREHHQEEMNKLRKQAGTQLARAQNSEVKFLKLQMSVGNQILDSTLKESEMRCMQITQVLQSMIETNQSAPAHLQTAEEQWRNNVKVIRDMKSKHIRDHEEQIDAVQKGTPLDVLPELGLPKPPPPPQVQMPMPGRMMPPMMPPTMPFVNTGPPPFQLQNGNSTARQPRSNGTASKPAGATTPSYPPGLVRPHKAKSSFEKIINQLSKVFPHCQKPDFMNHIQTLRAQRGGSLTGMTMAQIVQQVAERMLQAQQAAQQKTVAARVTNNWMAAATADGEEIFQEEEDPCLICFDELVPSNTTRLECGHRYHTECIRKWFQEQSTCPMCRNHTLLPDEYPSLT